MTRFFCLLLLLAACSSMTLAQETPQLPQITVGTPGGDIYHPNYVQGCLCYSKIAPNLVLSNPSSGVLSSATISVGAIDYDEFLEATVKMPGVSTQFSSAQGILTFTGVDTVENYMLMLRGVTFQDDAMVPTPGMRTLTVQVNDEQQHTSATACAYLSVEPGWRGTYATFQTDCAIISGGSIQTSGSGTLPVRWGAVRAKGDIAPYGLGALQESAIGFSAQKALSLTAASGSGYRGAGIADSVGLEKWLRWQCSGALLDRTGRPIFPAINGVPVTDFFAQLLNGQFGPQYAIWNLTLNGFSVLPGSGQGIYYDQPDSDGIYPMGQGAFVQSSAAVARFVDYKINNDLHYDFWKNYAISMNAYCRPPMSGTQFVNHYGVKLWVNTDRTLTFGASQPSGAQPFTNLSQISMASQVPANGNTYPIAEKLLFVDTKEGRADGTPTNISLNSFDHFFWKGLLYVNGSVSLNGTGGFQSVFMRSPDDWALETDPIHNTTRGRLVSGCFLDGVLFTTGAVSRTDNASVYGSYVSKAGISSGSCPYVYYNVRMQDGVFGPPFYMGEPTECVTQAPVTLSSFGVE